ncbi:hypothetical protein [Blastopirellula marina]|uniref:Uncharacterized protein n=1 Tax=Blastopirellula marina DSM 3645 TaxID=314230 RepID=A3ZMI3_9BACT|nr:hypothetical protein [Blastopirellula marina]EAQ82156.1 hypothetical protein DSM3645_00540 [Blastopirellula marina DSM 3645]
MISTLLVAAALLSADPASKPAPLTVQVGRDNTQVRVLTEEKTTILDIVSPHGIDKATIKRTTDKWPSPLVVRLHLKGLESLRVGDVTWSVSSTGKSLVTVSVPDGGVHPLGNNPYASVVRIVDSAKKIPLDAGGYFELTLPAKLLEDNPAELKLRWIDFYR